MKKENTKRILTGSFLLTLLTLAFFYSFILIISLILISIISWIEFNGLISKIFIKGKLKINFLKLSLKALSLIYLTFFSAMIFQGITSADHKLYMMFLFSICICSDIGGFIFGKTFKGKKLTKISPNKTISGSIGSFVMSLILISIIYYFFYNSIDLFSLIILTLIISLSCQLGDLFVSYLKRKARVKDTGNLLPGHGGILDRIDGMLLAIPVRLTANLISQI